MIRSILAATFDLFAVTAPAHAALITDDVIPATA
jgi:hypothetical protein